MSDIKAYKCSCGNTFPSMTALTDHQRNNKGHSGATPIVNVTSPQTFPQVESNPWTFGPANSYDGEGYGTSGEASQARAIDLSAEQLRQQAAGYSSRAPQMASSHTSTTDVPREPGLAGGGLQPLTVSEPVREPGLAGGGLYMPPNPGGGKPTTTVPVDTRTQAEREKDFYDTLTKAKEAAANGNPQPLKDFDTFFKINRDPNEYKKAFYADYSSDKLSASVEQDIKNWFVARDANNDGFVSKSEMSADAWNKVSSYAGSDGKLSITENQNYHIDRAGSLEGMLEQSGLPADVKDEIRNWHMAKSNRQDNKVAVSSMMAEGQAKLSNATKADGWVSLEESINYHRERLGMEPIDWSTVNSGDTASASTGTLSAAERGAAGALSSSVSVRETAVRNSGGTSSSEGVDQPGDVIRPSSPDKGESSNENGDKWWHGGSIQSAIEQHFPEFENNKFIPAHEANEALSELGVEMPASMMADGKVNEAELAAFIRNQVKEGNLVFTEYGGLGPASEGGAGSSSATVGIVEGESMGAEDQSQTEDESLPGGKGGVDVSDEEKNEEVKSALATRRSKDEDRLKKIMKQREKWGGASAGTGADSLAAPVITPASNSQGFGGIPGQR